MDPSIQWFTTSSLSLQGLAKRRAPGCVNAADKARWKWYAIVGTIFTKPGAHIFAKPSTQLSLLMQCTFPSQTEQRVNPRVESSWETQHYLTEVFLSSWESIACDLKVFVLLKLNCLGIRWCISRSLRCLGFSSTSFKERILEASYYSGMKFRNFGLTLLDSCKALPSCSVINMHCEFMKILTSWTTWENGQRKS